MFSLNDILHPAADGATPDRFRRTYVTAPALPGPICRAARGAGRPAGRASSAMARDSGWV